MNDEFFKKLVDLYAGRELPAELEDQMELAAYGDADLSHDMATLRRTVDALRQDRGAEFSEESYQRVLMKMYARGAALSTNSPSSTHLQYHLPMQG